MNNSRKIVVFRGAHVKKKFIVTKKAFISIICLLEMNGGYSRRDNNKLAGISFLIVQMVARGVLATPWSVHASMEFREWKG
jgi:hypothetical protein